MTKENKNKKYILDKMRKSRMTTYMYLVYNFSTFNLLFKDWNNYLIL